MSRMVRPTTVASRAASLTGTVRPNWSPESGSTPGGDQPRAIMSAIAARFMR